jgi:two-component system, chemotaxis family, protein-glutamate methylesterase/glutaminase
MATHDIVVIGASAGGVEALIAVARTLPADLAAALFVALHIPAHSRSLLPRLLTRAGQLPASHAIHAEPVRSGRIYIAPPNRHLLLVPGRIALSAGPEENNHRPAVDALFRSAASCYGTRVTGVVLSGSLQDGTAGLQAIKRHGGLTVVQDPNEAIYPSMPNSALAQVEIDHVETAAMVGSLLGRLVRLNVTENVKGSDDHP